MTPRLRAILLGTVLPLLVMIGAATLIASWIPRLPDEVALHWGLDGVDRTGSARQLLMPFAILTLALCVPLAIACAVVRGGTRRMLAGISAGLTTMMVGMTVGSVWIQVDVVDVTTLSTPGAALALPMAAGAVVGVLVAWLVGADPARPSTAAVPDDASRLGLPADQVAVWTKPLPAVPAWVPVLGVGTMLVTAVVVGLATGDWWLLVPMVLISAVMLTTLGWRAQVDRSGLTLLGLLGWPRYRVPADEILRADVVQVHPFAEFGGWGIRHGLGHGKNGTLGFVTRTGEGIAVERTGDRRVVVTVDDAARGAALLNTVADRSRASQEGTAQQS